VLSFEDKTTEPWFTYFQIASKTNPFNIIYDNFSIWFTGYRTEFSCLYLAQGHNVI